MLFIQQYFPVLLMLAALFGVAWFIGDHTAKVHANRIHAAINAIHREWSVATFRHELEELRDEILMLRARIFWNQSHEDRTHDILADIESRLTRMP